ncbi:MAG: hypothetical protein FWC16_00955 [Defluviitaleaceae bacterium]|nr:hypothetical protein [Defluviitaleaceae bacterium]MCL2273473.1 hypothetical protein [Defluviitaleaceae bacterium]
MTKAYWRWGCSAYAGNVYLGQVKTVEVDTDKGDFGTFMGWVEKVKGAVGVRTNADSPKDAKKALGSGATGMRSLTIPLAQTIPCTI